MNSVIAIIHFERDKVPLIVEEIHDLSSSYETVTRGIYSKVMQKGGFIIGQIRGDVIAEIPMESVDVLTEVKDFIKDLGQMKCNIGVGESSYEAKKALLFAIEHSKSIKIYEAGIDKTEDKQKQQPDDQRILKSEEFEPIEKKLVHIVQTLAENKDLFNKIKEASPALYASLVAIVAMTGKLVEKNKSDTNNKIDSSKKEVLKSLDKEKQKFLHKKEVVIQNVIDQIGGYNNGNMDVSTDNNDVIEFTSNSTTNEESGAIGDPIQKADRTEVTPKIDDIIANLHDNKDIIQQIHQSNPEAGEAILKLISIFQGLYEKSTGENLDDKIDEHEAKSSLAQAQDNGNTQSSNVADIGHIHPKQQEKTKHIKVVYGPGAIRQYSSQDQRVKDNDGNWHSYTGKPV